MWWSLSLYLPTRTTLLGVFIVRERALNCREGRDERGSMCGMNRIVGRLSLLAPDSGMSGVGVEWTSFAEEVLRCEGMAVFAGVGPELPARLLVKVMLPGLLGSGDAEAVEVEVGCSDSLLRPLLP